MDKRRAGLSGIALLAIATGLLAGFAGLRNAGLVDTARALIRGQLPQSRESALSGERVAVARGLSDALRNAGAAMGQAGNAVINSITGGTAGKAGWKLGNVKPHVLAAATAIGNQYGLKTMYGVRSDPFSAHPEGRAVDYMINDMGPNGASFGQAIAGQLVLRAAEWRVRLVIWNRQVWSWERRNEGWRPYTGTTNPHTDHVHGEHYS